MTLDAPSNFDPIPAHPSSRLSRNARIFLTLVDQGVVSVATYVTGVLVSRATVEGFGLYMLVFTLWVFGGEAHNSLVSTPQMLRLPRLQGSPNRARLFNGSLLVHQFALSGLIVLGLLITSALLFGLAQTARGAFLADYPLVMLLAAVSLGPIALRNFARNYCLATRDVPSALTLDIGVSALQLGGVGLVYAYAELHHWWTAVLIVAAANLFSSLHWLSMARAHFAPDIRRAIVELRRNWIVSRYIFVSSMLWTAGMYLYLWMISFISGKPAAGIWGACFALANLGNPLVMGIQNFLGPAIAHAHADRSPADFRRYVMKSTVAFVVIVLPPCIVMALLAEFLLTNINGGQYAGNGRITAILAFTMLLQGVSFPTSRGLFSLNCARLDMLANVGPLIVLATLGAWLIQRHGVMGAAISLVIAQTVGSATRVIAFLRVARADVNGASTRLATIGEKRAEAAA